MTKISRLFFLVSLAWQLAFGGPLWAGDRETDILERANAALSQLQARYGNRIVMALPVNRIMRALLRKAQGVAIFPGMFKAAAGIGGRHGRGVLLIREADGSWGSPQFLTLSGASAGIQVGVERANLILIFRTRSHLESLKKGKLTLGLEDTLAVGSIGRDVFLDTDVCLKTGIFSTISPSKGLFAGWSVGGNKLRLDAVATAAYDQSQQNCLRTGDPMGAGVPPPSLRLQMKLAELSPTLPTQNVFAPSRCDPPLSPQP
ncbi:MAG TPA: lipid-binding SYLF domain-containing protein [Gemmataceae bacterium]|nr:lipid-binding SYLF domain-containing protein [Gemmataceae bacterium]